jgi:hypothetical protein
LGVDQIVGAKLVNWEGSVVEADEDMLYAIRGAAESVGVIVGMTIKTYTLKQVLGSTVIFKSEAMAAFLQFVTGYSALLREGLPDALGVRQIFVNSPGGRVFLVSMVWSDDDMDAGRE